MDDRYDAGLETLFAKDFDEVDPNFSQTLQMSHSQACETVLSEFQSRLEEHSLSSAQLTQLFHEESLKYERHGYLRSLRYNELVFKDCLEELAAAHHSSSSGSDGSPSEDMSLKISQPLIFAQVLEVSPSRLPSFSSKHCSSAGLLPSRSRPSQERGGRQLFVEVQRLRNQIRK
jgi:hypothetical protein